MCGRYASSRRPEDLVEEFEVVESRIAAPLAADYNVAPTKEVYAVVDRPPAKDGPEPPQRQLRVLTWGLVPSWAKDPAIGGRMINARMETVAEKPAFKRAFAVRRCLLPADGYFEWYPTSQLTAAGKPRKQPFFIRPRDGGVGHIHDRMPLMVERDRWADWLDPRVSGRLDLLVPAAPGSLEAYPVSPAVGNVKNNGPGLVEPLPLEEVVE
jgi:putative SOS response-associated peptidase YedK